MTSGETCVTKFLAKLSGKGLAESQVRVVAKGHPQKVTLYHFSSAQHKWPNSQKRTSHEGSAVDPSQDFRTSLHMLSLSLSTRFCYTHVLLPEVFIAGHRPFVCQRIDARHDACSFQGQASPSHSLTGRWCPHRTAAHMFQAATTCRTVARYYMNRRSQSRRFAWQSMISYANPMRQIFQTL